jgi:hypothetical protein
VRLTSIHPEIPGRVTREIAWQQQLFQAQALSCQAAMGRIRLRWIAISTSTCHDPDIAMPR